MKFPVFFLVALAVFGAPTEINSQQVCEPRLKVLGDLKDFANEDLFAQGKTVDGFDFEITVSPAKTFTMFFSGVDGLSCLATRGNKFRIIGIIGQLTGG